MAESRLLADLPYVLTGATAAVLQGVPLPWESTDLALRWADADRLTYRWNPRWEEFGGRSYQVVPLPLVEIADPTAADLLRRYHVRLSAGGQVPVDRR